MANQGANHLGNNLGYIYATDAAESRIVLYEPNTEQGLINMRRHALVNAPIVANKSAVAIITVTAAAAAGNLTAINISGVNQIAANVPCASSVLATVAATWAAAINAFTPASGYDYYASASGANVYVFAPDTAGGSVNGVTPVISTSVGSLTATTTSFSGGSTNTGIIDDLTGYKYWLDANYGSSGIAGSTPALPNPSLPFLYAIEVTKVITRRGMETGIPTLENTISGFVITPDRYSSITTIIVDTEGGAATDYLVKINPTGFVESDVVVIKGADPSRVTTVVSEPNAAGIAPAVSDPNIYLTSDVSYVSTEGMLLLQFRNGIFTEVVRGLAVIDTGIISVTYAQAAALIAGSALKPGRRYKITDRGDAGLILDADDVDRFKMEGVYIANYSSVLYDEFCIYDFTTNLFRERRDIRGNVVICSQGVYNAIGVFPWGVDTITGNTLIDCVPSISALSTFKLNKFINVNLAVGASSTCISNDVINSSINITATTGSMIGNIISSGNTVSVGGALTYSTFVGTYMHVTINVGATIVNAQLYGSCDFILPSGYVMVGNFSYLTDTNLSNYNSSGFIGNFIPNVGSTLVHTADIAGATGYINTNINSAGTIKIQNNSLNLRQLTLGTIKTSVIVRPNASENTVIEDLSVLGGNIKLPNGVTSYTLTGANGDYIVLDLVGSTWYYNRHVKYN